MPQINFYLIARTDLSVPGPGRRQRTVLYQQDHLQGTLLDFGGRFALEPPRGNQHRQAARARLATEKPAVLRRHMPVWTVRDAAACGLTEAERAAIVGRSRRFGLSGRAGISSKCEKLQYSAQPPFWPVFVSFFSLCDCLWLGCSRFASRTFLFLSLFFYIFGKLRPWKSSNFGRRAESETGLVGLGPKSAKF